MTTILPVAAGASSLLAASVLLYRHIRPRYPVTVNCHFCDSNTEVPYGNRNCWDCPKCDQYNGFSLDGDYNKPIPAQYEEDLNHPISAEQRPPAGVHSTSLLCDRCSRNQLLKVKQLANFVSYEESNYDAEVDAYQSHLEHVYRLCKDCDRKVDRCLRAQDEFLHRKLSETASPSRSETSDQDVSVAWAAYCTLRAPWYVRVLRLSVVVCALLLLVGNAHNLAHSSQFAWRPQGSLQSFLSTKADDIYAKSWFLVGTALFVNILAILVSGRESLSGMDAFGCVLWLALVTLQSQATRRWLPLAEVCLMQPPLTLLVSAVGLWCLLYPRYRRAASPTRIRTRRLRPHSPSSSSPSSQALDSTSQFATSNHVMSQHATFEQRLESEGEAEGFDPLDELETLSIGEPVQINEKGLFRGSPSRRAPGAIHLNHFRKERPIISPARLSTAYGGSGAPSGHKYVRHHSFGLPKNRHLSSSASQRSGPMQRQLFPASSSQVDSGGSGTGMSLSNNQVLDDRASLFSEPRHRRHGDDSSSASSSDSFMTKSRASTECPVDTTFSEVTQPKPTEVHPKRSYLTYTFFGLSFALNIGLVFYFFIDISVWTQIASTFL